VGEEVGEGEAIKRRFRMPDKEFTQEDLDRMYDEAMKWQPPAQTPQIDPRAVLQKVLGGSTNSAG
jgi:hypothetical protein